jgi:ubiquinone/menaquinone biosynthesis C-methylase UbiE
MQGRVTTGWLAITLVVLASAGIAARQLGARPTEEWIKALDSPARVAALNVDDIIARLGLQPGQVVADLGAGTGVFSVPMAKVVGPTGKVYAVDVDKGLVDYIARKVKDQKVENVVPVLGKFGDPGLPATDVDLAFMHDVLHHVEDRQGYLKQSARYLKPGARFAIVELNATTGPHREDPKLQVTREHLKTWMAEAGFVPGQERDLPDGKWFVIYTKR